MLYHLGIVQVVVRALARGLSRTFGTSGAESLSIVAEIFLGMTEAPLLVRPYVARMTESELFTLMTAGMATVAGSVLIAYAQMLGRRVRRAPGDGEPALGAGRDPDLEGDDPRDGHARDARPRAARWCRAPR